MCSKLFEMSPAEDFQHFHFIKQTQSSSLRCSLFLPVCYIGDETLFELYLLILFPTVWSLTEVLDIGANQIITDLTSTFFPMFE